MSQFTNLGHAYYREYYTMLTAGKRRLRNAEDINFKDYHENGKGQTLNEAWVHRNILDGQKDTFERVHERLHRCATHVIEGQVSGDGFLTGTGYEHQKWHKDHAKLNDVQMGLDFDASSGVPILRGSGLKGGLRAWIDPKSKDEDFKAQRKAYLDYVTKGFDCEYLATEHWRRYLFEGGHPLKGDKKDRALQCNTPAYLGLVPCYPTADNPLFQLRNLAPQESPTSETNLISFLSLTPGTTVRVYFSFPRPCKGEGLDVFDERVEKTMLIFAYYISHFGLGAKHRYGYGRLRDIKIGKI